MSNFDYDLAIAYRIHPAMSSNPPPIFGESKYELARLCLESFKDATSGLRVKVFALLNDCPSEYEALFARLWAKNDLVVRHYTGIPPGTTLLEQSRILVQQTVSELVYFAEDDYFYLPDAVSATVDFLRHNPDVDFATPYEHPDLLTTELHDIWFETKVCRARTWRSSLSTTHTFMGRRTSLIEVHWMFERLFRAFKGQTSPDLGMWMALTKTRIYNPLTFARWAIAHRGWAGSMVDSWRYCWRQILLGRRYTLWAPRPSVATHMVARQLGMDVDWQQAFRQCIAAHV